MAMFHYVACSASGELREGELEADSPREAARVVRGQMLRVIHIEEEKQQSRWKGIRFSSVTRKHAVFFCRQLAVMVDSQPINKILASMEQQGGDKAYLEMVREIRQSVELGHGLASAMQKYEDAFSASIVHLIAAGEASGSLPEILARAADHLEQEYADRKKIQSAMFYPMILAISVCAVLFVMMVFILPTFVGLLEGLHVDLPLPARILLFLGNFLANYGLFALLGGIAALLGLWQLYGKESVRRPVDAFLLRLPAVGELKKQTAWMHILGTLSVLLNGGLRIDEALSMAGKVTDNLALQDVVFKAKNSVQQGYSLAEAWKGNSLFPAMLLQLVAAGESSGHLEEMLQKGADYCRISAENTSKRLQAMVEPALILVMGGIVLFFILAIVLPILDSMEAIS
ncbi:MAG: type II secretion system F family protein [Selenomonadaceae bacterium]|nr:type II secretion system F family protein [Selenomonadaceae bacterium]